MTQYDVIVAGAGPAGSTTARECAARGLSVLLLDKATFPRDKPCGGGVNVHTARLLPFPIATVTERAIHGVHFSLHQSAAFSHRWPDPLCYLTQRQRLDAFLVERAAATGATLREGMEVRAVERHGSQVVIRAGGDTFQGQTLVVADGVNGRTATLAGFAMRHRMYVALEGNVTPAGGFPTKWEQMLGLDGDTVPGGYGWLFPKGDHLNIGVIGWQHFGPSLRQRLDTLTRYYGFDPAALWGVRGYRLPIRQPGAPLADGNVILTGDAAGLVDPFHGEGIYTAVWSGKLAAEHLAAYAAGQTRDLAGYQQVVEQEIGQELRIASRIYDLFYWSPMVSMQAIRRVPGVWSALARLVRGDRTYAGLRRQIGPLSRGLAVASTLIRGTPRWRYLTGLQASPRP